MTKNKVVVVQGVEVHVTTHHDADYISLTDMVSQFDGGTTLIDAWLRTKSTIDFLGVWERLNNANFNSGEFDRIRMEAGSNRFRMSGKQWGKLTGGIGLVAKAGRYGGTFAHKDIAFEFGSWLSPEFKLYLIKEFQRLKEAEIQSQSLEWNIHRSLSKAMYRIHTDAIKEYLLPPLLSKEFIGQVYASEADLLNVALFGLTAKAWRTENSEKTGNIRDYATVEQLVVLASLESQNALLIAQQKPAAERLVVLNALAIKQMRSLVGHAAVKGLEGK